ncbi:MAG: glycoside hydrolase family 5 protein, partial [Oscillospiraceae bacterium]|nr:glycoside hydrolase family 5 protein [Oscillospiraceae bacterium]
MKNAKITQRLIAALLASIMLIATLPLASAEEGVTQGIVAVTVDSDILMNAHEITAAMGIGWNLGNTFDSRGGTAGNVMSFETSWLGGTPDRATSLTLIKKVKELGFNSIRVPVTWSRAASPENNWDIWDEYIERIHEVVTWAYDEGLYIVINIHHDDNAIPLASGPVRQITDEVGRITDEDKAEAEFFIGRIWEQVSERFEAFGQRLIFEGMNEPRTVGSRMEWQGGTEHERDMINHLNQLFVDTVRASGGNNLNRMLMLPTYAASAETTTLRAFVKPEDVSANLLALSVHTYSPFTWAHDGTGRYNGRSSIEATFNRLATRSRALDMPVVLGEWGSVNNVNNVENTSAAVRARHARDYVYMAASRGMATIWWDNGDGRGRSVTSGSTHGFGLINRTYPHAPYYPQIVTGMLNGQLEANLEAQGEVVLVCDEFDPCKSCESCDFLGGRYGFGRITNNRAN